MNRILSIALCTVIAACSAQSFAQYFERTGQGASVEELIASIARDAQEAPTAAALDNLSQAVSALAMKVSEAEQELTMTKQRVQAGLEPSSVLLGLESNIAALKSQLAFANTNLVTIGRLHALAKKVNVSFDKAPVPNFADLLSKLGGYAIYVDKAVPGNLTVTTRADNMPIGTILEFVAQSANLQLALDDKGAIKITLPSKILVGGQSIDMRGKTWPWSDGPSTGVSPNLPLGEKWKGLKDLLKGGQFTHVNVEPFKVQASIPPIGLASSSLTITPVGSSMVLISEPGSGNKGEPGYWLTLYAVKNGQLKMTSKLFHSCVRPPVYSIAPVRTGVDVAKVRTAFEKEKQTLKDAKTKIKADAKKMK